MKSVTLHHPSRVILTLTVTFILGSGGHVKTITILRGIKCVHGPEVRLVERDALKLGQRRSGPNEVLDLPSIDPILAPESREDVCAPLRPGVEATQKVLPDGRAHGVVEQLEVYREVDAALEGLVEFREAVRREE